MCGTLMGAKLVEEGGEVGDVPVLNDSLGDQPAHFTYTAVEC